MKNVAIVEPVAKGREILMNPPMVKRAKRYDSAPHFPSGHEALCIFVFERSLFKPPSRTLAPCKRLEIDPLHFGKQFFLIFNIAEFNGK